jgi:hypothetical protein
MVHKIKVEEIPRGLGRRVWYVVYYKDGKPYVINKAFIDVNKATEAENKIFSNKKTQGTFVDNAVVDVRNLL